MVCGQSNRPFKGQRPQERPKSFLAFGSRAKWAGAGWLWQLHSWQKGQKLAGLQVVGSRAELGWLQLCSWQKGQKLAECSCLAAGKKAEIGWLQ